MTADEPRTPHEQRLTAEQVGARVSAILEAAEHEAREIVAAAQRQAPPPAPPPAPAAGDLAAAVEALSARFDSFELETAARIEELWRELRTVLPVPQEPEPAVIETQPEQVETAAQAAARVRAIDLALAGYSREAIADELAVSMDRGEVEQLLNRVLLG